MTARTALPWYVHPAEDPAAWTELARAEPLPSFVVVNVHNGPGRADDPYYPDAIGTLGRHRVIGYVPLAWGARPLRAVLADVRAWLGRYRVAGVMLDEFPSRGPADSWSRVVDGARELGAGLVVGNPGVLPDRAQLEALDVTCVFEGTAEEHSRLTPSPSLDEFPPERIWHLVHGCTPDQLVTARRRSSDLGAGHVFVTDRTLPHPWGGRPRAAVPVGAR